LERGSQIMAGNDFSFATDNDNYLKYQRQLGSGGFGSVHEVLSQLFKRLIKIYDIPGKRVQK
jgi:hypothetical protein